MQFQFFANRVTRGAAKKDCPTTFRGTACSQAVFLFRASHQWNTVPQAITLTNVKWELAHTCRFSKCLWLTGNKVQLLCQAFPGCIYLFSYLYFLAEAWRFHAHTDWCSILELLLIAFTLTKTVVSAEGKTAPKYDRFDVLLVFGSAELEQNITFDMMA